MILQATKYLAMYKSSYAPVTLQAVPQAVLLGGRGSSQDASYLPRFGVFITLQVALPMVVCIDQNAPVLQLLSEVCTCKHFTEWRNIQFLNSPYVAILNRNTTESQYYIHPGQYLQLQFRKIHLLVLTVRRSEVEISNILNFHRMRKVFDILPLCHKLAYKCQTVIE